MKTCKAIVLCKVINICLSPLFSLKAKLGFNIFLDTKTAFWCVGGTPFKETYYFFISLGVVHILHYKNVDGHGGGVMVSQTTE